MASISKIGRSWRALVRKSGHRRCQTFSTQAAAKAWAWAVETEIEELESTGHMQPRGTTLADLIDRYVREIYPLKLWGRSKAADLSRLKRDLGITSPPPSITKSSLTTSSRCWVDGCGPVGIGSQAAYLVGVLETAADVCGRLAVPVQAVKDVRGALKKLGMVKKSNVRERRVLDGEIAQVAIHVEGKADRGPDQRHPYFLRSNLHAHLGSLPVAMGRLERSRSHDTHSGPQAPNRKNRE